jgi:putative transposase
VAEATAHCGHSERHAGMLVGMGRSSYRYRSVRGPDDAIRERVRQIARERPRWGRRYIQDRLRREGFRINHKKTERLYREEGVSLRLRKRGKIPRVYRMPLAAPTRPNQQWSMDFTHGQWCSGRRVKVFTLGDDDTQELLALEVDTSISGAMVAEFLERVAHERGYPAVVRLDNGPEFTGKALGIWATQHQVRFDFIDPGKPMQNAFREGFQSRLRDECLNQQWFISIPDAKRMLAEYREHYNTHRPHSTLKYLTPREFAQKCWDRVAMGAAP